MSNNDFIPRPDVTQAAPSASREAGGMAEQLAKLRGLVFKERQVAEKAMEETLGARLERDEYRQVLAAALRGEMILSERSARLEQELGEKGDSLVKSASEVGRLEGCNSELGSRLEAQASAHAEELATLKKGLQEERQRFERELEQAALQRGQAEGRLEEVQRKLEQQLPGSARALRVRAVGLFVCSGVALAAAIAFMPPLFRSLFGSPTAEEMLLAVGMNGWALLGVEALLLMLALGLYTRAMQDLKT